MKWIVRFCLILVAAASPAARADTITLAAAPWCPYVCEPGADDPGYLIELAEQAFAAAGHEVVFLATPYIRAITEVRQGRLNAVVGSGKDDTPDFVLSMPMGIHIPALAVRKDSGFKYEGIQSLETIRLGTTVGVVSWGGGLDEYIAANKGNPARIDVTGSADSLQVNIRKLLAGRIDAFANNAHVIRRRAAELGVADQIEIIEVTQNDDVYYAFSPALAESEQYRRILDQAVARMRASGELSRIMARYGLTDWAP